MIPVFEPELWGVSPLIPDGKTPTRWGGGASAAKSTSASGNAPVAGGGSASGKTNDGLKLWDGGSFDFHDILDIINPLQHLPIISSIYRSEVKDEIGAVPRILGSMLYGGGVVGALIGAASAIVNVVIEHETGKDLGQHIYTAIFGEGAGTRRTTQVAAPKTGETGIAAKKAAEAKPAEAAAPGAQAAAAAKTTAASPGAKPLSSRADAALQAFVAGLSKNASPAAAAAAKAAIAKRSLRISGAANPAAAVANGRIVAGVPTKGVPTKGEISTQFRRSDWYQRNQAILKAQAAALTKSREAAGGTHPAKSGSGQTTSGAAILQLFMNPSLVPGMPSAAKHGSTATGKPTAITATANTPPAKPTAANPAAAQRGAVAGPWVANEIAAGLSKYEALVKSRAATAGK
jgi:hypothetical protein